MLMWGELCRSNQMFIIRPNLLAGPDLTKPKLRVPQFSPQFSEIIYFSVERNCIVARWPSWLMSHRGQVDNCQATLPEGHAGLLAQPNSAVVRPAVTQGLRHCRYATSIPFPNTGKFCTCLKRDAEDINAWHPNSHTSIVF